MKRGFEEKNIFVLFGGSCVDKSEEEDSGYVLDFDKQKSYEVHYFINDLNITENIMMPRST